MPTWFSSALELVKSELRPNFGVVVYFLVGAGSFGWTIYKWAVADRLFKKEKKRRKDAEKKLAGLEERLEKAEKHCENDWIRPVKEDAPPFVIRANRKTRFISILNLKGGVGKTTITASLAYCLASTNRKVLLVDLDFQGTLTRLCVDPNDLPGFCERQLTVDKLLAAPQNGDQLTSLIHRAAHFPDSGNGIIVAREHLADVEFHEQARWVVGSEDDVRFRFRRLLHTKEIFDRFDFVLFDCPPRLSAACINGLACSDFLIVPVVLDQNSVQALPRTLHWVDKLQTVSQARFLGVVANMTTLRGGKLTKDQQNEYDSIGFTLRNHGHAADDYVFKATVKRDNSVSRAAKASKPAAGFNSAGKALFKNFVAEFEKRVS